MNPGNIDSSKHIYVIDSYNNTVALAIGEPEKPVTGIAYIKRTLAGGILIDRSQPAYRCHIFVCVNMRTDERKACAHGKSAKIRQKLKLETRKRWTKDVVRVSQSGCLGACEDGPNVMLYPQNKWFARVAEEDVAAILDEVDQIMRENT